MIIVLTAYIGAHIFVFGVAFAIGDSYNPFDLNKLSKTIINQKQFHISNSIVYSIALFVLVVSGIFIQLAQTIEKNRKSNENLPFLPSSPLIQHNESSESESEQFRSVCLQAVPHW